VTDALLAQEQHAVVVEQAAQYAIVADDQAGQAAVVAQSTITAIVDHEDKAYLIDSPASAAVCTRDTTQSTLTIPTPSVSLLAVAQQGLPGRDGAPGGFVDVVAGVNLGGQRMTTMLGGEAVYASCDSFEHCGFVLGLTSHAANQGHLVRVLRMGTVADAAFSWILGQPVYLGLNGVLTQTLPAEAVFSQIVGFPMSANTLFLALREPILLQ